MADKSPVPFWVLLLCMWFASLLPLQNLLSTSLCLSSSNSLRWWAMVWRFLSFMGHYRLRSLWACEFSIWKRRSFSFRRFSTCNLFDNIFASIFSFLFHFHFLVVVCMLDFQDSIYFILSYFQYYMYYISVFLLTNAFIYCINFELFLLLITSLL